LKSRFTLLPKALSLSQVYALLTPNARRPAVDLHLENVQRLLSRMNAEKDAASATLNQTTMLLLPPRVKGKQTQILQLLPLHLHRLYLLHQLRRPQRLLELSSLPDLASPTPIALLDVVVSNPGNVRVL
jgi:hypothetical protein